MSRREQKEVFALPSKGKVSHLDELLARRLWVSFNLKSKMHEHPDMDADEMDQASEIITPDQLTQLKYEALEHRLDEFTTKFLLLSEKVERVSRSGLNEPILELIKDSFSPMELVKGIYALSTQEDREIVITYPDSIRLGEVLKGLVPIEVELAKKCKNIGIDIEYIPASEFAHDLKSSFTTIWERKEKRSSAD